MIRTDLNLAYHHRDFEKEITDMVNTAQKPANANLPGQAPQAPVSPQAPGPIRQTKRSDPSTQFVGDNEQINFVTMNNGRMTANAVQADFIEVGYSLKDCKNLTTSASSKCLYRRTQTILDDDVTVGGSEIVMLENVTEFKVRYIGEGKQDWANAWKSTKESSDEVTKGKYPDAVEVSLSIEREINQKKNTYSMQFVIPIHFPNNSETKSTPTTGSNPGDLPSNPSGVVDGGGP
jgi:hypothetical protein